MYELQSPPHTRGFLNRIRSTAPSRRIDPCDSIKAHVLTLLNARVLCVAPGHQTPALGLDELIHHAPLHLDALARRIQRLLTAYETRLKRINVQCHALGIEPAIQVQIYGWPSTPNARPIDIEVELSPDGHFYLR